jgi:glycosyltransferase involved in cell wall biosynthesis
MAAPAPEVSVIIPTRDRWERLRHTLHGALTQADVALEVLVMDDGSTDGTARRVRELGDPRVRVFRRERPAGPAGARNAGIRAARARHIAFLDSDDLWAPGKLAAQLAALRRADAGLCYTREIEVDCSGDGLRPVAVFPPMEPGEPLRRAVLRGENLPPFSNVVVRADVLRASGGFDERLRFAEDWDLWMRLVLATDAVAVDEVLVAYVTHGANFRCPPPAVVIRDTLVSGRRVRRARRDRGIEIDWAGITAWASERYWGQDRRWAVAGLYAAMAHPTRRYAHLLRAAGAPLGRERMEAAMVLGRRVSGRKPPATAPLPPPDEPEWLDLYRRRLAPEAMAAVR